MHFEKKYPCPSSLWQHVASAALLLASKVEEAAVPIVSGARRGFTGELRQSKEMIRMSALDSDRSAHRHSSNVQLTLVRLCSFLDRET